jgi:glycerate dehydrogenase
MERGRCGAPFFVPLAADIPNLILTAHIAWASHESRQRLLDDVAANIDAYRKGWPRHRVA